MRVTVRDRVRVRATVGVRVAYIDGAGGVSL